MNKASEVIFVINILGKLSRHRNTEYKKINESCTKKKSIL